MYIIIYKSIVLVTVLSLKLILNSMILFILKSILS